MRLQQGKTIIIGLTFYNKEGEVYGSSQLFGRILSVSDKDGIKVVLNDGRDVVLPPDDSETIDAPRGEYRPSSKNEEIIIDPDYFSLWNVLDKEGDGQQYQEWEKVKIERKH